MRIAIALAGLLLAAGPVAGGTVLAQEAGAAAAEELVER